MARKGLFSEDKGVFFADYVKERTIAKYPIIPRVWG
jgi:hypothetical protein